MASGGKKKTTMAKLARENRLRERREIKKARKDERKHPPEPAPDLNPADPEASTVEQDTAETEGSVVEQTSADPDGAEAAVPLPRTD